MIRICVCACEGKHTSGDATAVMHTADCVHDSVGDSGRVQAQHAITTYCFLQTVNLRTSSTAASSLIYCPSAYKVDNDLRQSATNIRIFVKTATKQQSTKTVN